MRAVEAEGAAVRPLQTREVGVRAAGMRVEPLAKPAGEELRAGGCDKKREARVAPSATSLSRRS